MNEVIEREVSSGRHYLGQHIKLPLFTFLQGCRMPKAVGDLDADTRDDVWCRAQLTTRPAPHA